MQLLAYKFKMITRTFFMYGFVASKLVKKKKRIKIVIRKSYSWFTWSKSVDQPLKVIGCLKGAQQFFSYPVTYICLPQKSSTLFVPAKPSIRTTYRQVVLCCVLVSWTSSRRRKAPVLIL